MKDDNDEQPSRKKKRKDKQKERQLARKATRGKEAPSLKTGRFGAAEKPTAYVAEENVQQS